MCDINIQKQNKMKKKKLWKKNYGESCLYVFYWIFRVTYLYIKVYIKKDWNCIFLFFCDEYIQQKERKKKL